MTDKLSDRVAMAEGPSRELDAEIFIMAFWPDWRVQVSCDLFPEEVRPGRIQEPSGCGWRNSPAFTASLDAAVTLVPERVGWSVGWDGGATVFLVGGAMFRAQECATPALALCAAALKSRGL